MTEDRREFPNLYPSDEWSEITKFRYTTTLVLHRKPEALEKRKHGRDALYVVSQPYTVEFDLDSSNRTVTVPAGLLTDLVSVPSIARGIVGRVGPHLEAAIVHDFLYGAWEDLDIEADKAHRQFADRLMLAGMEAANIGWFKRNLIYGAIRMLGWSAYSSETPVRWE